MLIIEIHVDTIEESNPSTRNKREDAGPKRARNNTTTSGNRFWNTIKLSFPGSLIADHKNEK